MFAVDLETMKTAKRFINGDVIHMVRFRRYEGEKPSMSEKIIHTGYQKYAYVFGWRGKVRCDQANI